MTQKSNGNDKFKESREVTFTKFIFSFTLEIFRTMTFCYFIEFELVNTGWEG